MKKVLTLEEFSRKGGKASAKAKTKKERIELAKKGAKARWSKKAN